MEWGHVGLSEGQDRGRLPSCLCLLLTDHQCTIICICDFLTWNLSINIRHLFQALYRWSALCSRAIEACIRAIFETITIAAFWPPNFNASICQQHFRVSPNWNNLAMDICWIGEQRTLENCDDTPQDYSKQIQNKQGCWMEETSKTFLCLQTTWKCNLLIFLAQYLCELERRKPDFDLSFYSQ